MKQTRDRLMVHSESRADVVTTCKKKCRGSRAIAISRSSDDKASERCGQGSQRPCCIPRGKCHLPQCASLSVNAPPMAPRYVPSVAGPGSDRGSLRSKPNPLSRAFLRPPAPVGRRPLRRQLGRESAKGLSDRLARMRN